MANSHRRFNTIDMLMLNGGDVYGSRDYQSVLLNFIESCFLKVRFTDLFWMMWSLEGSYVDR